MNHLFQLFPRTEKNNTNSSPQLLSPGFEANHGRAGRDVWGHWGHWEMSQHEISYNFISNVKSCEIDEHESSWKNV